MRFNRSYFDNNTIKIAQSLLGHFLIRESNGIRLVGIISETEAYMGKHDLASHASRGKTKQNAPMFEKPGRAYVYFTYGMYHCLNIVTGKAGFPAAVLIRGIIPVEGENTMIKNRKAFNGKNRSFRKENLANGPGKLCVALDIDRNLNREDIVNGDNLWVEQNSAKPGLCKMRIKKTPRIGISKGKDKLWRFVMDGDVARASK